jgi:hypothetical protein
MKINGNLVTGGDIVSEPLNNEIFSPDSLRLLYIADQITLGRPELFLVDMSGPTPGASVRINGAIQGTGVKDFRWSPNQPRRGIPRRSRHAGPRRALLR